MANNSKEGGARGGEHVLTVFPPPNPPSQRCCRVSACQSPLPTPINQLRPLLSYVWIWVSGAKPTDRGKNRQGHPSPSAEIIPRTALTVPRLPERLAASYMIRRAGSTQCTGKICPLSIPGAERRSSLIQLSSSLPHQYPGGVSGSRSAFMFVRASCPAALANTKKNIAASGRSVQSKPS